MSLNNIDLMNKRFNGTDPLYKNNNIELTKNLQNRLEAQGGLNQQDRMIKDKRRSLNRALTYSYQRAFVKKEGQEEYVKALINPNKLKPDYDDKIISIGFETGFGVGDVFEWKNTNTFWLIYLQDLEELAYFRGDIRKCSYEINWSENGNNFKTYAAIRGPVETAIRNNQTHNLSLDTPNYTINFLVPKTNENLQYFKRYQTFYLQDASLAEPIKWRVETVDSISTPNIIEITAQEYYINASTDDVENGIVDGLVKPLKPNTEAVDKIIVGKTFIKPHIEATYEYNGPIENAQNIWTVSKDCPVLIIEKNQDFITLVWDSNFSGQFELSKGEYTKTIVVETLF